MGAPQLQPIAPAEKGDAPQPVREAPQIVLARTPGSHWLTAGLPPAWPTRQAVTDNMAAPTAVHSTGPLDAPALLVRWGSGEGPEGSRLTLNTRESIAVALDPERVQQVWAAARVRTLPPEVHPAEVRRRLRVDIFDGRVLAMHLRGRGGALVPMAWDASREGTLTAWHAMRALHALRLDFGAVWIGIYGYRTYALAVEPAPALTRPIAAAYAGALRGLEESGRWWPGDTPQPLNSVILGADPEFVLRERSTGQMLAASDFFPRFGVVGCDRQIIDRVSHALALVELRPAPSASPAELTQHIRQALVLAARRMPGPDVEWLAGSRPFPRFAIGGHIHMSGLSLSRHLLVALDNYLALPVMMLERAATARLRRRRYGFLGDVRLKEHGGFEYRTLPSWLVSPALTQAVLSLAKLVATHHTYLNGDWLAGPTRQEAFHTCDKDPFYDLMPGLWRDLEALPGYAEFEPDLTLLRGMVERRQRWNEHVNIRDTWRV